MKLYDVGRLCVKTMGRDNGNYCVVVDVLKDNYVLIDGNVRRRKCSIRHLEPLKDVLKIKKNDSHVNVIKAMKQLKLKIHEKKIRSKVEGKKTRPIKTKKKKGRNDRPRHATF